MEEVNVELKEFVRAAKKNRDLAMRLKESNLELQDLMQGNIDVLAQAGYITVSVNWRRVYKE